MLNEFRSVMSTNAPFGYRLIIGEVKDAYAVVGNTAIIGRVGENFMYCGIIRPECSSGNMTELALIVDFRPRCTP